MSLTSLNWPAIMTCFHYQTSNLRNLDRKKEFISNFFSAQTGETMGASAKDSKVKKLSAIPGVGAASAKKLVDAKLDTVAKVAAAGTTKLVKAGIQAALAKKIAAAAKKLDGAKQKTAKAGKTVKETAKKAATKAKSAAKKSTSKAKETAKKAPAKAKEAAKKVSQTAKQAAPKKTQTESKGGKIGPSRGTPISKMPWFKNLKK